MAVTVLRAVRPVSLDLLRSFTLQKCGAPDPTAALVERQFEKVHLSLAGHVVHHQLAVIGGELHHTTTVLDDDVDPDARGDAAADALRLRLDADAGADAFAALAHHHPVIDRLHRRHHGLRLLPVPWLFDVAASMVLQQRVKFMDAARSFAAIARRFGPQTPLGRCFPHPRVVAALAPDELMPLGVDGQRARALLAVAREALHTELLAPLTETLTAPLTAPLVGTDLDEARAKRRARLQRLPGIGPWTTAMILGFGFGDPDAVVTGDVHLPHLVTGVLGAAGDEPSDARMQELLQPFAGQRFRVLRLLWAGGFGKRPARGLTR